MKTRYTMDLHTRRTPHTFSSILEWAKDLLTGDLVRCTTDALLAHFREEVRYGGIGSLHYTVVDRYGNSTVYCSSSEARPARHVLTIKGVVSLRSERKGYIRQRACPLVVTSYGGTKRCTR